MSASLVRVLISEAAASKALISSLSMLIGGLTENMD
jgi:hypothetical protein